jgi:hypothetical protein
MIRKSTKEKLKELHTSADDLLGYGKKMFGDDHRS